jgi:hypothetical protein
MKVKPEKAITEVNKEMTEISNYLASLNLELTLDSGTEVNIQLKKIQTSLGSLRYAVKEMK